MHAKSADDNSRRHNGGSIEISHLTAHLEIYRVVTLQNPSSCLQLLHCNTQNYVEFLICNTQSYVELLHCNT